MATITKDYAIELWKKRFGDVRFAKDCFGSWICIDDYNDFSMKRTRDGNNKEFNYGWSIDHILPKSLGGKDYENNLEIIHCYVNLIKSDSLTFDFKGKTFYVKKVDGKAYYGIFDSNGNKISKN